MLLILIFMLILNGIVLKSVNIIVFEEEKYLYIL